MDSKSLAEQIRGKEVHFRLLTNDLLETGKPSVTAVGTASSEDELLRDATVKRKEYTDYDPQSLLGAVLDAISGDGPKAKAEPSVFVVVEEKGGNVSADDARYVEWLAKVRGERPRVILLHDPSSHAEGGHAQHLLGENEDKRIHSFWKRQWRRAKALPAPITKDAAIAAIPRTAIPVGFSIFLAYLKRNEIPLERAMAYTGLAFGFAIGFALLNQTVLNWFTFWSEFTREACDPYIKAAKRWMAEDHPAARLLASLLGFISARGDVFIAGPLLGVGCTYLARLALGSVGETASVLSLYGFFLVVLNVVVGSIAGGPYPQAVAHLRAVGKISNRTSMYLGILDTVKMEVGRVADFGMQTLYNVIQVTLAVVFWVLLLVVDRCYLKPDVHRVRHKSDAEFFRRLFKGLRAREDIQKTLAACP